MEKLPQPNNHERNQIRLFAYANFDLNQLSLGLDNVLATDKLDDFTFKIIQFSLEIFQEMEEIGLSSTFAESFARLAKSKPQKAQEILSFFGSHIETTDKEIKEVLEQKEMIEARTENMHKAFEEKRSSGSSDYIDIIEENREFLNNILETLYSVRKHIMLAEKVIESAGDILPDDRIV